MMALELEQALRRLEETTGTLLATGTTDLAALCRALDDRADAITRLALVSGSLPAAGPSAIDRLTNVLVQGEEATRRLIGVRREATVEWNRLASLSKTLADPESTGIEIEG